MFYCTKLDWTPRRILSAYACRWAIECTFENCKQFLGLEDPANRLPKAVRGLRRWRCSSTVWWSFGFTNRDISCYVFPSDLVPEEGRAIVCRHVDDPEAGQLEEEMPQPLPKQSGLKTWIAQLTELLSRTG